MRLLLDKPEPAPPAAAKTSRFWPAAAVATALVAAVLAFVHFQETTPDPEVIHASIPLPENSTSLGFVAVAPDGRRVAAFFGVDGWSGLWLRDLSGSEWVRLEASRGARTPFWSPDSRSIGFFADNKLKIVPAAGGPAKE